MAINCGVSEDDTFSWDIVVKVLVVTRAVALSANVM